MKKTALLLVCIAAAGFFADLGAQENTKQKEYSLSSKVLEEQCKELDKEILNITKKLATIVKDTDLLKTKDIRILPYQSAYRIGDDYIEIERHKYIKANSYLNNPAGIGDIRGIRKKSLRVYISGQTISKLESRISEKMFNSGELLEITITDTSPLDENTDDITFTQMYKNRKIFENKKLGDIKNTTASPIRNEIKRDFIVPHLTQFFNSLMFITEAYARSNKDSDKDMAEFLRKSAQFQ